MKLPHPFIQIPLRFDSATMAAEITAMDESRWRPHPQAFPGNSMLPLIAVDGDPEDERFSGRMLPTSDLERCPYIMQVLASLGATLGRTRLMRLAGKAEVTRHVDQGYYWAERVRVHVPVVTQPTVRFECGDAAINMAAGECWIFDTWRQHRVLNDANQSRIHLVVDTVGGGRFWDMVAGGRPVGQTQNNDWHAALVVPDASERIDLNLESVNVPVVMSPWEMDAHFQLIFAEAIAHRQLAVVRAAARRFLLAWRGLWACHGDSCQGHQDYQLLLQAFLDEVRSPSREITLRNGITCFSAIMTLVAKMAVTADKKSSTSAAVAHESRSGHRIDGE